MSLLKLPYFFDAHVHFRDQEMLAFTVPATSRYCSYATVMPNLDPPVTKPEHVREYRARIKRYIPAWCHTFTPLMTAYLTPETQPEDVEEMLDAHVVAFKLYVKNKGKTGTTHSGHGLPVETLLNPPDNLLDSLHALGRRRALLLVHAEWPDTYFLEAEEKFLQSDFMRMLLGPLTEGMRIVIEHISSAYAVQWVRNTRTFTTKVGATITAHHPQMTTDDVLGQNHNFCRPPAKTPKDREAVREAMLSGEPCFFFGTDSAPWDIRKKERAQACAGCYTAETAAEDVVQQFDEAGLLHRVEDFTSTYGCLHYNIPKPQRQILLIKRDRLIPNIALDGVQLWRAGETLSWTLCKSDEERYALTQDELAVL